jgi:hypothetical protein
MSTFQPRFEILPPAQIQLWKELQPLNTLGFVLYGGTALALRLGHRVSVDFDFFIEKKLKHAEIKNTLPFLSKATVIQDEPNAFSAIVSYPNFAPGYVKVSFFGDIGFGRVGTPQASEDGIMQVASLDDLKLTEMLNLTKTPLCDNIESATDKETCVAKAKKQRLQEIEADYLKRVTAIVDSHQRILDRILKKQSTR